MPIRHGRAAHELLCAAGRGRAVAPAAASPPAHGSAHCDGALRCDALRWRQLRSRRTDRGATGRLRHHPHRHHQPGGRRCGGRSAAGGARRRQGRRARSASSSGAPERRSSTTSPWTRASPRWSSTSRRCSRARTSGLGVRRGRDSRRQVSSNNVVLRAGEIAAGVHAKSKVINLLRLPGGQPSQQVMLQVRFAEVNRAALTELGRALLPTAASRAAPRRSSSPRPDFDDDGAVGAAGVLGLPEPVPVRPPGRPRRCRSRRCSRRASSRASPSRT